MKPFTRLAMVFALLATPALAAQLQLGDTLGTTVQSVSEALTTQGYQIIEIERTGGRFETYVSKDGAFWEFYIDAATGKVIKVERAE